MKKTVIILFAAILGTELFGQGGGNLINFGSSGDNYVYAGSPDSLMITNSITVEAWIYPTALNSVNEVVNRIGGGTKNSQTGRFSYGIELRNGTPYYRISHNGSSLTDVAGSGPVSINKWQHIAYTFDGSYIRGYLDGRLHAEYYTPGIIYTASDIPFVIGSYWFWSWPFRGKIDEVRVWDSALSAETLRNWMHKGVNSDHPNFRDLKGYWKMNESSGTTVYDSDDSSVNGTLNGSAAWALSTAPLGIDGVFINTVNETSAGPAGAQIRITLMTPPDNINNLGAYQYGSISGDPVRSGETFPAGITLRSNVVWGTFERGAAEAAVVIDYSSVQGLGDPSTAVLLTRPDAASSIWTEASGYTRDGDNLIFSFSGSIAPAEYAVGTFKVIYVNGAAVGLNNGTTWTDAYTLFQTALDSASAGDKVWVAKGTYKPTYDYGLGLGDRGKHFRMKNGVSIYGGFAGTETVLSQRNISISETILSGDIGTSGDNSDNCYHVIYNPDQTPGIDSTAVMDGFTVKYGNADGTGPDFNGGGAIYNNDATPVFYNMYITQNTASYGGGGINNFQNAFYYGMPRVRYYNLLVTDNYSGGNGGGIYDEFSKAHYSNATVVNNRSEGAAGGHYAVWTYSDLFNSIIRDNDAGTDGNDVYYSGIYRMYNCSYSIAAGDVFNAGGASLTADNCINSDPAFVDPGSYDYRLSVLSPCINSGNNSYNIYGTDIRGSARIQEGTIDMGAFERIAGTDPFGIYYITASGSGAKNGKSWADAMENLHTAITATVSGDRIWVGKGIYKPSNDNGLGLGERGNHFQMKNGVRIFGGFSGIETSESQRTDFGTGGTNETILSGDIGTPGINTDNCYHVIYNPDMSPDINNTAVIDGFTVSGGYADGTAPHNNGGGIHNSISTPYYKNISVVNNYAAGGGGGIFNSGTSSTPDGPASKYVNVLITGNGSGSNGGGVSDGLSTNDYINCTIAYNNSGASGGGISSFASNSRLKNCIVWGNYATGNGDQINLGFTSCYLDYTCYSNSAGDVYGGFTSGSGNITSSPVFTDPTGGDYRLYGFSPCVNSGNNIFNSASTDLRGQARIQNTTIDIGAFEWTTGIDPENLIVPDEITIVRSADSSVLSWTAVPGAASYKIFRSEDPYSGFALIGNTPANSYTDSEVLAGNKYFYYVIAVSAK